jgi:hypothetical protein
MFEKLIFLEVAEYHVLRQPRRGVIFSFIAPIHYRQF